MLDFRKIREQKNMTQKELGDAVGLTHAAISAYETGIRKNVDIEIVAAIAQVLDVKIDQIYKRE